MRDFDLTGWDMRMLKPKNAKRIHIVRDERLKYGIAAFDTIRFNEYISNVLMMGLYHLSDHAETCPEGWKMEDWRKQLEAIADMIKFAIDEHTIPFVEGSPEYVDAKAKLALQQQDCIEQAFELLAEIFFDLKDN